MMNDPVRSELLSEGFRIHAAAYIYFCYFCIHAATFIYLTFFDGYVYTAWNWIIVIPINGFLATIWPIYWGILHWIH